jgi:hypothetical protein
MAGVQKGGISSCQSHYSDLYHLFRKFDLVSKIPVIKNLYELHILKPLPGRPAYHKMKKAKGIRHARSPADSVPKNFSPNPR